MGDIKLTRSEAIDELREMKGAPWNDERMERALDIAINSLKIDEQYDLQFEGPEECADCISRQALYDELQKWDWQELYLPVHFKENIVDELPNVAPVILHDKRIQRLREAIDPKAARYLNGSRKELWSYDEIMAIIDGKEGNDK